MGKVLILLKANLRSSYNSLSKKASLRPLAVAGIAIGGGIAFYLITKLARFLFGPLSSKLSVDIAPLTLNIVLLATFIYLLLSSFSIILSTLYFSNDTTLLLSLPIREKDIFLSRFLSITLEEDIYLFFLVYPFFVGYGIVHSINPIFYIETFLFVMLFPIIPLVIAVFIVLPLSKKVSPKKLQSIITTINVLFSVAVWLVTQLFSPAYNIVSKDTLKNLSHFLPTNIGVLLTTSFSNNYVLFATSIFIVYLAISLGLLYLALPLSTRTYKEGLGAVRRIETVKISRQKAEKETKTLSFLPVKIRAIVQKDIKMIRRDQTLYTRLLPSVIMIVFFFIAFVFGMSKTSSKASFFTQAFFPSLFFILSSFLASDLSTLLFYREGENAWIIFMSKITPQEFLWAKFFTSFLFSELINILFFIILIFMRHLSLNLILLLLSTAIFLPFLFTAEGVAISAMFPVFKEAKNPKKMVPVKVPLIEMVLEWGTMGGASGIVFLDRFLLHLWNGAIAGIVIFILLGIITFAISFPLMLIGTKRLQNAEFQ